jgi:hypothetical protein
MLDNSWFGWGLTQSAISGASGLFGVFVGTMATLHGQRAERKHSRIVEQLQQFYSPMWAIREELSAKREASLKVNKVARDTRLVSKDKSSTSIQGLRDYDLKQWWHELMPGYDKMLTCFADHMWLAEDSTREHYKELVSFVEVWRRYNAASLDAEVTWELDLSDNSLVPLYDDLQYHFMRLRNEAKK